MARPSTPDRDASRLLEIGQGRSQEAFEELFSRYGNQAYGLAFHLTGDRETAQDVVQQAMLDVWKSAARFDPERGCASKWILRIVATTALKCRRRGRRALQRTSTVPVDQLCSESRIGGEDPGQGELREALSGVLSALPEADRRLIALYFGAGLSQYEIARMLSLSQCSISYKVNRTLEQLRIRLAQLGFGALSLEALPALLSSSILKGPSDSLDLQPRVSAALLQLKHPRKRLDRTGPRGPTLVGLAGLLAAVGIAWGLREDPQKALHHPANGEREGRSAAAIPVPVSPPRYHRKWVFDTPAPEEVFRVVSGAWVHVPPAGSGVGGYMLNKESVQFELRLPPLRRPFAVFTRVGVPGGPGVFVNENGARIDRFSQKVGPAEGYTLEGGEIENYCERRTSRAPDFRWHTTRTLFSRDLEENCIDGQRRALIYRVVKEHTPLYVRFWGSHRIAGIEVRELGEEEAPNFDALRAAIQAIPKGRRRGLVPLQGFQAQDPSRPVSIQFFSGLELRPE